MLLVKNRLLNAEPELRIQIDSQTFLSVFPSRSGFDLGPRPEANRFEIRHVSRQTEKHSPYPSGRSLDDA
jgi:hypothetical protein